MHEWADGARMVWVGGVVSGLLRQPVQMQAVGRDVGTRPALAQAKRPEFVPGCPLSAAELAIAERVRAEPATWEQDGAQVRREA